MDPSPKVSSEDKPSDSCKPAENSNPLPNNSASKTCTMSSQNPGSPHSISTQSHSSTAQNVFSGRPNAGLMCSNLRANPFSVSGSSSQSSGILAKPKFSLKPPSFSGTGDSNGASTTTADQPAVASTNPFLRPAKLSYEACTEDLDKKVSEAKDIPQEKNGESGDNAPTGDKEMAEGSKPIGASSTDDKTDVDKSEKQDSQSETNSNYQQPLLVASTESFTFGSNRASQAFVFGEALDSRVTNVAKENGTNGHANDTEEKPKVLTLEEAATEYKKQQESGPILPEVELVTGEEGESNVLQISCKLFLFNDKEKSWAEKGRGVLRLNDFDNDSHSRIVMRTVGIHRVILNTSIWPSMICEKANQKSLRITGTEEGQVHVYLLTGSPADMDHLYNAVTYRVKRLKQQQVSSAAAKSTAEQEESDSTSAKRKTDSTDDQETSPKKVKADDTTDGNTTAAAE